MGAIAWAIACGPGLPSGGHASGGGKGGGGGTGGGGGGTDGGDAGCLTDAGCSGAGQVCSIDDPDSCASGYACTLSTSGDVYTCVVSADAGCDAGECLTNGQTCDLANPDNGGCEPGLYCDGQISATGVFYTCQTGIDAG